MLEDGAYTKLSKWLLAGFPGSATSQTTDTIGMRLLQRFSTSLLSVEYPSAADVPPNLRVFQRKVELSVDTLKHLQESTDSVLEDMNTSPVGRKKGKSVTENHRIDPLPFNYLGIAAPTTDMEVRDVCKKIFLQLRSMLEVCGFIIDSTPIELNNLRTISLFSGGQRFHRSSDLRTWRQNSRSKGSQINLGTQRLPWFS